MPLWGVEVLYTQTSFGRESSVTAKGTVGAQEQPSPVRLRPIGFVGLRVEARANKAGGFVEVWSAESLMETGKAADKAGDKPSTSSTGRTISGGRTRPRPGHTRSL